MTRARIPTCPSSPMPSTRPSPDGPARASRPRPLAVRGTPAELQALSARTSESIRAGQVPPGRPRSRLDRGQSGAHGTPATREAGHGAARQDGGGAGVRVAKPGAEGRGRLDAWRQLAHPGHRSGRSQIQGRDPDGQGLPPASRGRPSHPARRGGAGPGCGRSRVDAGHLAGPRPAPPGRAQEPAPGPRSFVAGIKRQHLQRRGPARGRVTAPSASGRAWRPRRSTPSITATRETLASAVKNHCRERVPPTFEKQVRDFLAVHDKGGQACPRWGPDTTEVKAGGFITSYCRGCQH